MTTPALLAAGERFGGGKCLGITCEGAATGIPRPFELERGGVTVIGEILDSENKLIKLLC